MTTIHDKLRQAQVALKAPKGQYNSFGKYKYRSAEDILEAVKPVNAKCGLTLHLSDDIVEVATRIYVKATAVLSDGENMISVTAYAREEENKKGMDASQITGSASSYARKYALNGLYLIDDTKDADTDEYHNQTQHNSQMTLKINAKKQSTQPTTNDYIMALKKVGGVLQKQYNMKPQDIAQYIQQVAGKPWNEVDSQEQYHILKKLVDSKGQ